MVCRGARIREMVKSVKARKALDVLKSVSAEAKNATIESAEFDAVMGKLLQANRPITKREISERVRKGGASHAVTRSGQR